MRFMLVAPGLSNKARVSSRYVIQVKVRGGTQGVIGTGVSAICPATLLTTSNGTLLVATGYGPMLRMRRNERTLTNAGVPAPVTPLAIATGVDLGAQPDVITRTFDYTRFGSLQSTFGGFGGPRTETAEGRLSREARTGDLQSFMSQVEDLPGDTAQLIISGLDNNSISGQPITVGGTTGPTFQNFAKSLYINEVFLGLNQTTTGPFNIKYTWKYMVFSIQAKNVSSPGSGSHTTFSGRYQAFMRYVDKDNLPGDPSPISADIVINNEQAIVYTNCEVPTDNRVARRQIFRNVNGSSDVFYLDIDTDDLTSTTLVSKLTDDQLKLNYALPVFDDNGYNLLYLYGQPPIDKPFIAEFSSIIFGAGFRVYTEGNVAVTNGSDTITGIGTNWPASFVGRQISVEGRTYSITAIDHDASPQTLTIESGYGGPTRAYSNYSIQPYYGNSNLLNWSEAGMPESWPIANALSLPDDDDEVTGLITFANSLWILKANSIYQFNTTLDPNRDGDYKPVSNRGCVNQRCAIQIQSVALMLDRTGVHVFRGMLPRNEYQVNSTPDHLSKAVGDLFRFEGTWLRLNWDADKCFWHAAHNKELTTVRWYVAMQGFRYPQHAICYDYIMDRWWVEEYPIPITSSCQSAVLSGRPILGGYGGKVYQPDSGSLDLAESDGTRLSVTACLAGVLLQLDGTPPTCVGMPVAIVAGTGRGQQSMIVAQDDNEIEVDQPFTIFPDDTSVVQIGAIKFYAQTGEFNYPKIQQETSRAVSWFFRPTTYPQEAYLSVLLDGNRMETNVKDGKHGCVSTDKLDPQVFKVDMADDSGCATINLDGWRERDIPHRYTMQAAIEGFSGQEKPTINNIYLVGSSSKHDLSV